MKASRVIFDGIIRRNPTFVLILGMCPTLGTTSTAITGLSMGIATLFVLVCSNGAISALRRAIPGEVRIPAFIVVIASFVTILQMLMQAFVPSLYSSLGIFIPLIVVNCILLGRAESFAARNNVVLSLADGLGVGIGFAGALTLLGKGSIFGYQLYCADYGALLMVLDPGAFIALGFMIALFNHLTAGKHA